MSLEFRWTKTGRGLSCQAVILAAGQGSRLASAGGQRPKCIHKIGGVPLINHQLLALSEAGISDAVIVVGFEHEQVRACVDGGARFVHNHRFAATNSLYSFLLAEPWVEGDAIVLNSDVYFHPELVARLVEAGGDALLYDSTSGHEAEQMKVSLRDGMLVEMSKDLAVERTRGENVGMLRLSATTLQDTFDAGAAIVGHGGEREWLAAALNRVAAFHRIRCLDVAGVPWVEIDFADDLVRAETEVFPAVTESLASRARPPPRGRLELVEGKR